MNLTIIEPGKGKKFGVDETVRFTGTVNVPAKKVTLESTIDGKTFVLGENKVTQGKWTVERAFSRSGLREIIVEAVDASGTIVARNKVQITIGAQAPAPDDLLPVRGIKKVDEPFKAKVIQIAEKLGTDPNFLMAIMSFETGGTFDPAVKNKAGSGATGLIQFLSSTAKGLGTTTQKLAAMSALEQLVFVEKYFLPFKGRLMTVEDAYMAVLFPKAVGEPNNFVLFKTPSKSYKQNIGLDLNKDGKVTKSEAAAKVIAILAKAS